MSSYRHAARVRSTCIRARSHSKKATTCSSVTSTRREWDAIKCYHTEATGTMTPDCPEPCCQRELFRVLLFLCFHPQSMIADSDSPWSCQSASLGRQRTIHSPLLEDRKKLPTGAQRGILISSIGIKSMIRMVAAGVENGTVYVARSNGPAWLGISQPPHLVIEPDLHMDSRNLITPVLQ